MANKKNQVEEQTAGYVDALEGESLSYVKAMEETSGDLVRRGAGYIALVSMHCIHGFDALKKKSNKKIMEKILQDSADESEKVVLLSYCILDDAAFFIVKSDREEAAKVYARFVAEEYGRNFNSGFRRVDKPFRDATFKRVYSGTLAHEIRYVHSLSPDGDPSSYPYNSYRYLLEGTHDGNLIINIELGINSEKGDCMEQLLEVLDGTGVASAPRLGKEPFEKVLSSLQKEQLGYRETYPENQIDYVLTETAARSETPYAKVAKKMGLSGRYDLTVSALVDFIMRRNCPYPEAVASLKLKDTLELRAETLIEINRIHHYSYDFIASLILGGDEGFDALTLAFCSLHEKRGATFERLCVDFHIVKNIREIRSKCGF